MINEVVFNKYFNLLLAGDKASCAAIVQELLSGNIEVKDIYINLFQRSLYKVGELWEYNRISVSVEHLATAITECLLNLIYPIIFSKEHTEKKALIACVANEYHQVGGRMVADIFELNGWNGYFLGANNPTEELVEMVQEKKPDVLGLSFAIYFNLSNLIILIERIRTLYPSLEIIVGGQAFKWGGREVIQKFPKTRYIESLEQLESFIAEK